MIDTDKMTLKSRVDVGMIPYWATTGPEGELCFVSLSGDDAITVLRFDDGQILARVPVGRFPQRSRLGQIPENVTELLD